MPAPFGPEYYFFLPQSKNVSIDIDSTIVVPAAVQGCGTWSVIAVSEEHRLGVFQNSVLVKVFGRNGQEVTGNWRQLHSATHHDLYCYLNVIRVVK